MGDSLTFDIGAGNWAIGEEDIQEARDFLAGQSILLPQGILTHDDDVWCLRPKPWSDNDNTATYTAKDETLHETIRRVVEEEIDKALSRTRERVCGTEKYRLKHR